MSISRCASQASGAVTKRRHTKTGQIRASSEPGELSGTPSRDISRHARGAVGAAQTGAEPRQLRRRGATACGSPLTALPALTTGTPSLRGACPSSCNITARSGHEVTLYSFPGSLADAKHPWTSDYMPFNRGTGTQPCDEPSESCSFDTTPLDDQGMQGFHAEGVLPVRFVRRPEIDVKVVGPGSVIETGRASKQFTVLKTEAGHDAPGDERGPGDERISCGSDCKRRWDNNGTVSTTLIALPDHGEVFEGWDGCHDARVQNGHDECVLLLKDYVNSSGTGFKDMDMTASFGKSCSISDAQLEHQPTSSSLCPSPSITVTYSGTVTASYVYNETRPTDNDQQQTTFDWSETGSFAADGSLLTPGTLEIQNGTVSETDPDNSSVDCTGTLEPKQTTFASGGPIQAGAAGADIRVQAQIPMQYAFMVATGSGDCAEVPPEPLNALVPPDGGSDPAWSAAELGDVSFPASESPFTDSFPVAESGTLPIGTNGDEGSSNWSLPVSDKLSVTVTS